MADAGFRPSSVTQNSYPNQLHQQQQQQQRNFFQRTASPISNQRIGFPPTDIASPTRSPGARSPAFSMYNHGHQSQHSLLIGDQGHQRYQNQMNVSKHFPNHNGQYQQQQQQAGQHHQTSVQQENGASRNGLPYSNHQHTISTSTLSNATPYFTPSHLKPATTATGTSGRPDTEHWAEQIRLAQASREATQPHHYARTSPGVNKLTLSSSNTTDDLEEVKGRPSTARKSGTQAWQSLDFSGQGLRSISTILFKYHFLENLYFNNNRLSWLTPQISQLRCLTFLDLSGNQIHSLPGEIGMLSCLKRLHVFDNNLETLPFEMGYLWRLEFLGVEGNPLNEELKTILAEGGTKSLIRYMREQADVLEPPTDREWVVLAEPPAISESDRFTVLNANILADAYASGANGDLYEYVARTALSWEHRMPLTLNEIKLRNADIICLQEVDHTTFTDVLRPTLAKDDYKGVYWQKRRAKTVTDSKRVDGCAIFYNNARFIMLDKQLLEYGPSAIDRADMKGQHDVYNRLWVRDEIAAIVFLENRVSGSRLIVGNTHIHWDPAHTDVKIIQTAMLMDRLAQLAQEYTKWPPCKNKEAFRYANGDLPDGEVHKPQTPGPSLQYNNAADIPLLLCGDFNSEPGSCTHELLSQGSLRSNIEDLEGRSYGTYTKDGMSHPFSLKSSYANIGEMAFTNYTPTFRGVLDYIWYSTNSLQNTGLLGEIDANYLSRIPGFPNWHYPSDHIPLVSEFVVKPRKEKKLVEADFGPQSSRDRGR